MRCKHIAVFCLVLMAESAFGAGLPEYFKLAPGVTIASIEADENYGEAKIPTPALEEAVQRGHRWRAELSVEGVPDDTSGKDLWAKLRAPLLQDGWTIVGEWDVNPFSATVHRLAAPSPGQGPDSKPGSKTESWAYIKFFGRDDIRMELIQVGGPKLTLKIMPPAAKPEIFKAEAGDYPFLPPPPGSKFSSGAEDPAPFTMQVPGQDEPQIVSEGSITKNYAAPAGLSNLEFVSVYRDALTAAGWTILSATDEISYTDSTVSARFAGNGRTLWAYLHLNGGELSMHVGDGGKKDLALALKNDCHVVLVGVFFDFDKATLKPESGSTLARARDALKANAAQLYEVQGHTDAVGNDGYNLTLSMARAQAVQAWLVANGAAATQLSAQGYGKTRPIADNDSDEGRARNRRVELACRK